MNGSMRGVFGMIFLVSYQWYNQGVYKALVSARPVDNKESLNRGVGASEKHM